MDPFLSRIYNIVIDPDLGDSVKIKRIEAIMAEAIAVANSGVIECLVSDLRVYGLFFFVNSDLTSYNCPTVAKPSLDGARLDEMPGTHRQVLAELKRLGRRPAAVAEGLLYGLTHLEELSARSWIRCYGQVVVSADHPCVLALGMFDDGGRFARLCRIENDVIVHGRVLSFPMTAEELARRDAEDAATNAANPAAD